MTRNMGSIDRVVRGLVVAPILVLVALAVGPGTGVGVVLLVVAGVMALTAAVGFCPAYVPLRISTCPRRAAR
jgi:hypothetical protein